MRNVVNVLGGTISTGSWLLHMEEEPGLFWSSGAKRRWLASGASIGLARDLTASELVIIDEKTCISVQDHRAAKLGIAPMAVGTVLLGGAGLLMGAATSKKAKVVVEVSAQGEHFLAELDHETCNKLQGEIFTLAARKSKSATIAETSQQEDPETSIWTPKLIACCCLGMLLVVNFIVGAQRVHTTDPSVATASAGSAVSAPKHSLIFDDEADRFTAALKCPEAKFMHSMVKYGQGVLYGCTMGDGQAKLFINESAKWAGKVENIKVMWNNYDRDMGFGIHTGREDALSMVRAFAKLHASHLEASLAQAFLDVHEKTFASDTFEIEYKWTKGFGLNEHLLVATPR